MGKPDKQVNGLLDNLVTKVTDRWLTSLVLPGLVWVCIAMLAGRLGWAHALDPRSAEPLIRQLEGNHSAGQGIVVAAGALTAAVGVSMTAVGLAAVVRRIWPAPASSALTRWLRGVRQRRWEHASQVAGRLEESVLATAATGPGLAAARARQQAISLERPEYPTWVGDRMRASALRIHRAYGLDVTLLWPRLWVVLDDPLRADISAAQDSYVAASVVAAWAVLYFLVGLIWGPALLIAAGVLAVGSLRARSAAEVLCQLMESATDLYGPKLAEQLRIPCDGALTSAVGWEIDRVLRKEPPRS